MFAESSPQRLGEGFETSFLASIAPFRSMLARSTLLL